MKIVTAIPETLDIDTKEDFLFAKYLIEKNN